MKTSLASCGVPRTKLADTPVVPGADQQDVTGTDLYALGRLGSEQFIREHVVAGLEPWHSPQPWHVDQDTPTDDAVPERLNISDRRTALVCRSIRCAAEQRAPVADVTQGIEVADSIVMKVDPDEVLDEPYGSGSVIGQLCHPMLGRLWIVRARLRVEGQTQADRDSRPHQPGRRDESIRGEVVQRAPR